MSVVPAVYNEFDPFAAAWLRALISEGHITDGEVDPRSIVDLRPADLSGRRRVHLFAGIGVWDYALGLAGWPEKRQVWTASCPCPPFSSAGKQFVCPECGEKRPVPNAVRIGAFDCIECGHEWQADERHLWPAVFPLIRDCLPDVIMGEQVSSPDGLVWLDVVRASLEMLGYAVIASDTPASGVGAPNIRQRLYWCAVRLADSGKSRLEGYRKGPAASEGWNGEAGPAPEGGEPSGLADARRERCKLDGLDMGAPPRGDETQARERKWLWPNDRTSRAVDWLADANRRKRDWFTGGEGGISNGASAGRIEGDSGIAGSGETGRASPLHGFWADADWLGCRDDKWRPVEPGTFPLADGAPARVGRLRGYGNALNAYQAAAFIEAVMGEIFVSGMAA